MNDNDELNDSAVLSAVRDTISGLPMPAAPRLEAITARGRARHRRRLAGVSGLSVAAAGACAALVVGLTGGGGSARLAPPHGAGPQHEAAPQRSVPGVHLAAFTVAAGPDGTTTLTLNSGQVVDPSAVRQALAAHGIPALVTAGEFCRTAVQPAPGVGSVVVLPGRPLQTLAPGQKPAGPGPIVINGSAIPSGTELSIGYRQDPNDREISFTLIVAGAPLTCTSIPDHGPHPDDGPSGQS
ncbi:MAG TPA: hypothetical protein VME19_21780 [Streptosporangiaceae bacterium]|nr:hypothetical protein [Streptosporangiaceae bacterium]